MTGPLYGPGAKEQELVTGLNLNSAQLIPLLGSNQLLPKKQKSRQDIEAKLKLAEYA